MWGNPGFKWLVLGLHLSDLDKFLDKHNLGDAGEILCEPHVCYYHGCRDLPVDRFWLDEENDS
mgnify:CR=1 FL=1